MGALAQAAIEMALEDYDNQINGRPIQVCIEDTQSDASVAVQMAQKDVYKRQGYCWPGSPFGTGRSQCIFQGRFGSCVFASSFPPPVFQHAASSMI